MCVTSYKLAEKRFLTVKTVQRELRHVFGTQAKNGVA